MRLFSKFVIIILFALSCASREDNSYNNYNSEVTCPDTRISFNHRI